MNIMINSGILGKYNKFREALCSFCHKDFSVDISGHFARFACNHSYGYAHNILMGPIVQTDSLTKYDMKWPQNPAFS